ncbi:uncharacterized protein LOC129731507 [Wyeomyia smithii]|uniref:uncharacterized protein LOC129731507 n=1 Tax=Wyeomyia smithii TaxID=174621 RepID=UPI002467BB34|nr:uncharacterized protein LOC129731507 [Wyeomyia smithii]
MTDPDEQRLDFNFQEDARDVISLMFLFPDTVRKMVKNWLATFYTMGTNFIDKQTRNQYLSYMLMQLEVKRALSKPFDEPAPDHIHEPLAKKVGPDEYIKFFEKCEKYYLRKKRFGEETDHLKEHRMNPTEFLRRLPAITSGVVTYGACFSKDNQ